MATPLPPARNAAPVGFSDARGCKEWLNALPLTNIPMAQSLVLEALRTLNGGETDALERLKCLELMRDKIAFLQGEQRSRYFGKSLPLSANDSNAWSNGRALLEEMEAGYRACLDAPSGSDDAMVAHRALAMQRVIRYIGAQMLFHASVYRRFDPVLWTRLHEQFALAERQGLAEERVKDSLESEKGGSSGLEAYLHVVLLQAAYLSELTAPQIDFVEALLRQWIRKVKLQPHPVPEPQDGSHALAVDLDKPIGARPLPHGELGPRHRVLDAEALSRSMRKRIHGLQKEDDAATLGLPLEAAAVDALGQLQRLHKLWCEGAPPRPPARVPEEKTAGMVFGLADAHFFVGGGKAFEQPDRHRELTSQEKQDIEVFGEVSSRTQSRMATDHNYSLEPWTVIDEMLGAWRLQRPSTASKGVAIGRLVAMRAGDSSPFYLGQVSALVQEVDGRIVATVSLFPGRPQPVAARSGEARGRASNPWTQAFRLPPLDRLQIPVTYLVPSGLASRKRSIELHEGTAREATVAEVVERGADFDRIRLD